MEHIHLIFFAWPQRCTERTSTHYGYSDSDRDTCLMLNPQGQADLHLYWLDAEEPELIEMLCFLLMGLMVG